MSIEDYLEKKFRKNGSEPESLKSTQIWTRVKPEFKEYLKELASAYNITLSNLVRVLIEKALKSED